MALGAESEVEISLIDQGVKCLFLKVWGKTVKVTKPQGAKRKFTLNLYYNNILYYFLRKILFIKFFFFLSFKATDVSRSG